MCNCVYTNAKLLPFDIMAYTVQMGKVSLALDKTSYDKDIYYRGKIKSTKAGITYIKN